MNLRVKRMNGDERESLRLSVLSVKKIVRRERMNWDERKALLVFAFRREKH